MKPRVSVAELRYHPYVEYAYGDKNKSAIVVRVRNRSIRDLDIPNGSISFLFYDRLDVQVQIGRETETLSATRKPSGVYYYGRAYSLASIRREFPDQRFLLHQMRLQNAGWALRTMFDQWRILDHDVLVVSPSTRRVRKVR